MRTTYVILQPLASGEFEVLYYGRRGEGHDALWGAVRQLNLSQARIYSLTVAPKYPELRKPLAAYEASAEFCARPPLPVERRADPWFEQQAQVRRDVTAALVRALARSAERSEPCF